MRIRQNPLWFWNAEETSTEIQNRGTSGPKIGHVDVSDKKIVKVLVDGKFQSHGISLHREKLLCLPKTFYAEETRYF